LGEGDGQKEVKERSVTWKNRPCAVWRDDRRGVQDGHVIKGRGNFKAEE